MMNKTRQMISLDEDNHQSIHGYMLKQKWDILVMPYLTFVSDLVMSKRKKEWNVTTITETVSIELKNKFKKQLKKLQPGVNNTHNHIQIANYIGHFSPSEFNKKAASIIFLTCCIGWFFLTLFTKKDYKKSPYPEELFAIIIENIPITKSSMLLKSLAL